MDSEVYGVVILNYNSFEDSKKAVLSVQQAAIKENYHICLVDGGSTNEGEFDQLCRVQSNTVDILKMNENKGYAKGNNVGAKYLIERYNCQYIVIMNPDVLINQKGTIEGLINAIKVSNNEIIGAQPLVDNVDAGIPADMQINVRKVFSYEDILINSWWILRRIFKKKHEKSLYIDEKPYCKNLKFEVPSGAFFVINARIFDEVNFFDEDTFLYAEEIILGHKIKKINKAFVLVPQYTVSHYQGKTTDAHGSVKSKKATDRTMESMCIYMKKYLGTSEVKIMIYKLIKYLDYYSAGMEKFIVKIAKKVRATIK